MQMKHRRKSLEHNAFLRLLKPILARVILIIALERLHSHIVFERLVNVLLALYVKLNVIERLYPSRLVVDCLALDVRDHLSLVELRNAALHLRVLHLGLQIVQQHSAQLLHVMLHERVECLPAERARQLLGTHRLLAEL